MNKSNQVTIQKKDIVLSIKPKYAKKIKREEKKWEYRKLIWSQEYIDKIYLYETSPVQKITCYFTTSMILKTHPKKLWSLTKEESGISKEEFFAYFKGKSKGYAIQISHLYLLQQPTSPKDLVHGFNAPQNFMYANIYINNDYDTKEGKQEFIGAYVPEDLKQDLITLAEKEERGQSYYLRKFVKEGLKNLKTKQGSRLPHLNGPPKSSSNRNSTIHTRSNSKTKIPTLTEERKQLIEEIKKGIELTKTHYCKKCKKRYSEEECPYCNLKEEESK